MRKGLHRGKVIHTVQAMLQFDLFAADYTGFLYLYGVRWN